PLNTPLTEALMRAHAATGDLKAVETVYRSHLDGLHRTLNSDPEESTNDLHRSLVDQPPMVPAQG
ncbi:MAG: bacterial transcriptional activator domain-containing protein, partial [Acidimicrobiales bacterium]